VDSAHFQARLLCRFPEILPLLLRSNLKTMAHVLRLWSVLLVSNLLGTYLFALCIARIAIFDPHVQQALLQVSHESPASFGITVVRRPQPNGL
jgi:formate-nitrite transporter family protein